MWACRFYDLLIKGACVEIVDKDEQTPLHLVTESGQV
jgi:hypothetical protein